MTRAQYRASLAWFRLLLAGGTREVDCRRWIKRRWGVEGFSDLTAAQARHAGRQLNAWRNSCRRKVT